ncbi:MAG: 4-hydroxythreonine-4-phosphate dehydrogenase PdxA [Lachnospiraceae bacterium]|nr:4-hydroxythreonine-4-phosphate dehydrogenase PdxA [Lachnospiraceae bacterium]
MTAKWIPTIGITMGDAAGVGAEIIVKAALHHVFDKDVRAVLIGDERQLKRGMMAVKETIDYKRASSSEEALNYQGLVLVDTHSLDAERYPYGEMNERLGLDAGNCLKACVEACRADLFDAICFGPNHKASLKAAGFHLNGAIDLLAGFYNSQGPHIGINILDKTWVTRVTDHIPLREVGPLLSIQGIVRTARMLNEMMKKAGFADPRIAVAGLNPHNGENGTCGMEEIDTIIPAVRQGRSEGINLFGPYPADTLFYRVFNGAFDGAVTMYHDQGQIAMKLHGFGAAVSTYGGLLKPATTCEHGTAYDIAGTGCVDSGSWEHAFALAKTMAVYERARHCS